jgi:hypothetical protein
MLTSRIAKVLLQYADSLQLSYETVEAVLFPINQILELSMSTSYYQVDAAAQQAYLKQSQELLTTYNQLVYKNMVVGQSDIVSRQNNYQLTVTAKNSYQIVGSSVSVESSLSDLEAYNGRESYKVGISNLQNVANGVKLSYYYLNQYSSTNKSVSILSRPLIVDVDNVQSICSKGRAQVCDVSMTLPNSKDQVYLNMSGPVPYHLTYCYGKNTTEQRSFTYRCPQGKQVTVRCKTGFYGMINTTCPYSLSYPVCKLSLASGSSQSLSSCRVTSYDSSESTCVCSQQSTSSGAMLMSRSADMTEKEWSSLADEDAEDRRSLQSSSTAGAANDLIFSVSVVPEKKSYASQSELTPTITFPGKGTKSLNERVGELWYVIFIGLFIVLFVFCCLLYYCC